MSGVEGLRAAAEAAGGEHWEPVGGMVWVNAADRLDYPIAGSGVLTVRHAAYIAAANPAVILSLLDRLADAEAAVERVRSVLGSDPPAKYDADGNYEGRVNGGEHRTTGGRAWCFGCNEWCHSKNYCCPCCEPCDVGDLRDALDGPEQPAEDADVPSRPGDAEALSGPRGCAYERGEVGP